MISLKSGYARLSAGIAVLFVILMLTEVRDRLASAAGEYRDFKRKEKSLMTPDAVNTRRKSLLQERDRLSALSMKSLSERVGREGGLYAHLAAEATAQVIVLESFAPGVPAQRDGITILSFVLKFTTDFHRAAGYVNRIEIGSPPVAVTSVTLLSDPLGNSSLKVTLTGRTISPAHPFNKGEY